MNRPLPLHTFARWLVLALLPGLALAASACAADGGGRLATAPGQAAIASAHHLATDAGFQVLDKGGNAFDAAVAVSAALSVVEPISSGLGGGGFFLLHQADLDRDVFIDARETAPAAASSERYRTAEGKLDASIAQDGAWAAGFPGLPLKIFCPQVHLTLMDSLNKRVNFLQTVVDELGLEDVDCVHARAEEGARMKKYREQYDLAVSRAVARLPILCEYCLPFVKRGGHFLALKGRAFAEEVEEAAKAIKVMGGSQTDVREVHLPGLDDKRAIITVTKTMPTPKAYPRKAGTPAKNPL